MEVDPEIVLEELGITLEQLTDHALNIQNGLTLMAAAAALLLYDLLVKLDDEIQFVWSMPPRISFAKLLYLITRYLMTFTTVARFVFFRLNEVDSDGILGCAYRTPLNFTVAVGLGGVIAGEIVLVLRIWVIYYRSKLIGIFLLVILGACMTFATLVVKMDLHIKLPFASLAPENIPKCPTIQSEKLFWLMGDALLLEGTGFVLLIWRAYHTWRLSATTPILTSLLMHGVIYYAVVFVALILTSASTLSKSTYMPVADANVIVAVLALSSSRLILSLRGSYFKPELTEWSQDESATINFGFDDVIEIKPEYSMDRRTSNEIPTFTTSTD